LSAIDFIFSGIPGGLEFKRMYAQYTHWTCERTESHCFADTSPNPRNTFTSL
jgi:hypothetical protein